MTSTTMGDFEREHVVQLLPAGARRFRRLSLPLDPIRHSCGAVKEKAQVRGLLVYAAQIVSDEAVLKNWYTDSHLPIVIAEVPSNFEESDEWSKNPNQVARLLNAHVPIDLALLCLGRSYWHEGFDEFFAAASILRDLVDKSGRGASYQRRLELACCIAGRKELRPVIVFNENTGEPMPPPLLKGDVSGGPIVDEWIDRPRSFAGADEKAAVKDIAAKVERSLPGLTEASKAVVRVFGYHHVTVGEEGGSLASASTRRAVRVVPFTAFFVSPKHLLTTRTALYSNEHRTFASSVRFTRRTRAMHGMLRHQVDLHDATVVPHLTDFFVSRIRQIGVNLEDDVIPPDLLAAPWNDLVLLEVSDPAQYSPHCYLLPSFASGPYKPTLPGHRGGGASSPSNVDKDQDLIAKGASLYAVGYPAVPDGAWIDTNFGPLGHNALRSGEVTADHLRRQWWSFDTKACSVGGCLEDVARLHNTLIHSCTTNAGMRGSPLLEADALVLPPAGSDDPPILTYCGIQRGRDEEELRQSRDHIASMSTSDVARNESLAFNMRNEAIPSLSMAGVLLYQEFIAPAITTMEHRRYLRQFLSPFDIFVNPTLLSACHRTMLTDAGDWNEYGMDFYEHRDLANALACFREGAKMFSTATIPNLSQYEVDLRTALQTNVAAVIVARMSVTAPPNQ